MADESEPQYVDSSRLKQVNLELGGLASKHKACRLNSGVYSALGAVVLAISLLGLIHLFPAGASDWTQNPNSPVYEIAAQNERAFALKSMMVTVGFVAGLAFLYTARSQCKKQRGLWRREDKLRKEMRQLRDRLYVLGQMHPVHEPDPKRQVGQTTPLEPDEARGEYVGVYNPPASRRDHGPEHA